MATTETTWKSYKLGKHSQGNRTVVNYVAGETHDLPAAAQVAYTDQGVRFPYNLQVS